MPPKRPHPTSTSTSTSSRKKPHRATPKTQKQEKEDAKEDDTPVPGGGDRDGKGEEFWELSGKRRITISKFSGKYMVGLREYYEKDGEALPGKKGISLSIEQFNTFVSLLPCIEAVLLGKGEEVLRPEYGAGVEGEGEGGDDGEEEEDGDGVEEEGKKNFEATSEEEGG